MVVIGIITVMTPFAVHAIQLLYLLITAPTDGWELLCRDCPPGGRNC